MIREQIPQQFRARARNRDDERGRQHGEPVADLDRPRGRRLVRHDDLHRRQHEGAVRERQRQRPEGRARVRTVLGVRLKVRVTPARQLIDGVEPRP